MIDEKILRQTLAVLKPYNQLFEVRILGKKPEVYSGYFTSADTLLNELHKFNLKGKNCFITLNSIDSALYSRDQRDCFIKGGTTTSDNNVISLDWLYVDVDPIRPSGTSSTDEQLEHSKKTAYKIFTALQERGFSNPITALSGNGCHLLYRIALKNNKENQELIKKCLAWMDMCFSDDVVSIDTSVFNPSRVCCLYGTLKQKGTNTTDRPHRMTRIFYVPPDLRTTDKAYLIKIAEEMPSEQRESYNNKGRSPSLDIEKFMSDNGITFSKTINVRDGIAYMLDECPFDSGHKNGDSKIFRYNNGAIAFKCHHSSCSHYRWQDVRQKYDPECYNRQKSVPSHNYNRDSNISYEEPAVIEKYTPETFRTPLQILTANEPEPEYIKTGITVLDAEINGLPKTELSLISGLRASGKSTLLAQLLLNVTEQGYTSICYSGELSNRKYTDWIFRIAAGHNFVTSTGEYNNGYFVTTEVKQQIAEWMNGKLWLYNNKLGNKFSQISQWLRDAIADKKADLVILDNMMILDFSDYSKDRYEAQKQFVTELLHIAQQTNCHICFVAHPRKSFGFLRLEDVSGANEIVNLVSQAFIVHRVNADFERNASQIIPKAEFDSIVSSTATNIIDIAKDREGGAQDVYIKLWYEPISKRLRNSVAEFHVYPWQNDFKDTQITWDDIKKQEECNAESISI